MKCFTKILSIFTSVFLVSSFFFTIPAFADHVPDSDPNQPLFGHSDASPGITPTPYEAKIAISGEADFVNQTRAAIQMLAKCAPEDLETADTYIESIREFNRSGMEVDTGTFLSSNTTAFAPGYSRDAQIFWYAGSIVHDARHRWQSQNGMVTDWGILNQEQREQIESDARAVQIEALQQCLPLVPKASREQAQYMLKYLTDMQEGITDCDYCKVEWANRNW